MKTGALPDGRKAGEALGEGGISPYQGRNTSGATSSARSVTKLNLIKSPGGNVLNMKFDPSSTNSHAKMMNFVNFLRTFAETGGLISSTSSQWSSLDAPRSIGKLQRSACQGGYVQRILHRSDPMGRGDIDERFSWKF